MKALFSKAKAVVFGNRVFQTPPAPYVGEDSVLRLGPVDYRQFLSDIAGGGHIAGYPSWQGAPAQIVQMIPTNSPLGGGVVSGYGAQPGPLLDLSALNSVTKD